MATTLTTLTQGAKISIATNGHHMAGGVIGRISLAISVNTYTRADGSDGNVSKLFSVAVETTSGEISLTSPAGPVLGTTALIFDDTDLWSLPLLDGDSTVSEISGAVMTSPSQ